MAPRPVAREFIDGRSTVLVVSEREVAGDQGSARVLPAPSAGGGEGGCGTLARLAAGAFLPEGYPDSVSSDYLSEKSGNCNTLQGLVIFKACRQHAPQLACERSTPCLPPPQATSCGTASRA